ncbi:MAG: hypothetical protein IJI98_10945 [Methanosphaera sp.]|nr:hypothetical protein [Methanobrevibacter sp.]MBQ6754187.1 hypothetical protein [Bacteroidales bacterium]MBR0351309.1 hypothetical protein [Clostridia bacterium]MBR0473195.1 hypothetical protein [Methanosphaera sp.]
MASLDYSSQLKNLVNAQKKAQTAELQNTRNQALSNLQAEQQQNAANYATQRSTANAQNRLSARNFQEYLASTGRANSGLAAQASMQNSNNLNTSLNNIYSAENAANADILRRRTDAQNAYNTGLAAANANIQANYIQALLDQKAKAWERAMQEKEYKENVRQFNENLKLQKQQLQQRFSSGSGGGRTYRSGGSKKQTKEIDFKDSPVQGYTAGIGSYSGLTTTKNNNKGNKTKKGFSFSINDSKFKNNKKNNPTGLKANKQQLALVDAKKKKKKK